jgi:hypothetical protein
VAAAHGPTLEVISITQPGDSARSATGPADARAQPLHGPATYLGTKLTSRRLREFLGEDAEELLRTQIELRREQRARRLAEERAERLRRLTLLQLALMAAETPLEVGHALLEHGLTIVGASAGGLLVVSEDGLTLENLVAVGYPRDLLAAWQWIPVAAPLPVAEAVRTCAPLWIGSAAVLTVRYPDLAESLAPLATRAVAALPLLVATRPIGVVSLTFEEERVRDGGWSGGARAGPSTSPGSPALGRPARDGGAPPTQ